MDIIKLFDILSCIITIITLNLVNKTYKAWLYYSIGCVFFITVCINKALPGLTIMGIVLFFTGLKNYITNKKSKKIKIKECTCAKKHQK